MFKKALVLAAALHMPGNEVKKEEPTSLLPSITHTQADTKAQVKLAEEHMPAVPKPTSRKKLNDVFAENGLKYFLLDHEILGLNFQALNGRCKERSSAAQCPLVLDNATSRRDKHGLSLDFLRLQGRLTDEYTINRIFNNYTAKVSVIFMNNLEALLIEDIMLNVQDPRTPDDVKINATTSDFAEKIRAFTSYNKETEAAFKEALVIGELAEGHNYEEKDFTIKYGSEGQVTEVQLKGKHYNPAKFVLIPHGLKKIDREQPLKMKLGNLQISLRPEAFLNHFARLEKVKADKRQFRLIVDKQGKSVRDIFDMEWFTEDDGEIYQKIVSAILEKHKNDSDYDKLRAIATWLQVNFRYMYDAQNGDVPKLAMISMLDGGGDCDDGYIAFKTLANAAGLGHLVGYVETPHHIAPMIQGSYGDQQFQAAGTSWSPVNIFGHQRKVDVGSGNWDNVVFYGLPDGTISLANENLYSEAQVKDEGEIDQSSENGFNQAYQEFNDLLAGQEANPEVIRVIVPAAEFKTAEGLVYSGVGFRLLTLEKLKKFKETFYELTNKGPITEDHYLKYVALEHAYQILIEKWRQFDLKTHGFDTVERAATDDAFADKVLNLFDRLAK